MRFAVVCPNCRTSDAEARWVTDDFRCRSCRTVFNYSRCPYSDNPIRALIFEELLTETTLARIAHILEERWPEKSSQRLYQQVIDTVADLRKRGFHVTGQGNQKRTLVLLLSARKTIERARLGQKWKSRGDRVKSFSDTS